MMKHFSLASGLAALACLRNHGAFALQTSTDDAQVQLDARQDSWDGVTPQLIEAAIDAMNNAW